MQTCWADDPENHQKRIFQQETVLLKIIVENGYFGTFAPISRNQRKGLSVFPLFFLSATRILLRNRAVSMAYDFESIDVKKFSASGKILLRQEEPLDLRKAAVFELCFALERNPGTTKHQLEREKNALCKKYGLHRVIKNAEIVSELQERGTEIPESLAGLLQVKEVRSLSGITNIAIMTRPERSCPYNCIYCPQGLEAPKSYTGYEPAARRARQNGFDAFKMTGARLEQLRLAGHAAAKCELIVQGGTFNMQPGEYQLEFLKGALDAFNGFVAGNLAGALDANENARHRMIGLTIETRPDCASKPQVLELLEMGATRIELGVQSLSDEVYKKTLRGHTVAKVAEATKTCKDALLKVCYHMMPGLFATVDEDEAYFRRLFEDPQFRPDMLKIYPTLVMPGTELYEMWKRGEYAPYDEGQAVELLCRVKKFVPKYVRIMRVERDIPSNLIGEGIRSLNIRQMVKEKMAREGQKCSCIRCREVGSKTKHEKIVPDYGAVELERYDYDASGGKEIFLSMVDRTNDALMGICRLRKPSQDSFVPEIGENCGVRELHVYGDELELTKRKAGAAQHRGYGKKLLAEAERMAKEEFGSKKLVIISGAGVKPYYYKLGYARDGTYVSKRL